MNSIRSKALRFCVGCLVSVAAISTPIPAALAEVTGLTVTLRMDQASDYNSLVDEAVRAATATLNQAFSESRSDVIALTVLVSRQGQILPILTLQVSRTQWQQRPDIHTWAQHSFSNSILLGMSAPGSYDRRFSTSPSEFTTAQQRLIGQANTIDLYD